MMLIENNPKIRYNNYIEVRILRNMIHFFSDKKDKKKKFFLIKRFLNLLFRENEEVCVSPNKYAYQSITLKELIDSIDYGQSLKLYLNSSSKDINSSSYIKCHPANIEFISLNPIKGNRQIKNVTALRNFLIEIDTLSLENQLEIIKILKIPYSALVYSGNRSIHIVIALDKDLPNLEIWRYINNWIMAIVDKADKQVSSPIVGVRFPFHKRKTGLKRIQYLLSLKNNVSHDRLFKWLNQFKDKRPKVKIKPIPKARYLSKYDIYRHKFLDYKKIPKKIKQTLKRLRNKTQLNRNVSWFNVALFFAKNNFDYEQTIQFLESYFVEEFDFKKREWLTCIKSAFKYKDDHEINESVYNNIKLEKRENEEKKQ